VFGDYGKVFNEQKVTGEHNDPLASLGVGFEVIVRRNFSLRLDYGVALLGVDTANVNSGDGELHLSALVRY
jgi:hemolysin activation/secretion protein